MEDPAERRRRLARERKARQRAQERYNRTQARRNSDTTIDVVDVNEDIDSVVHSENRITRRNEIEMRRITERRRSETREETEARLETARLRIMERRQQETQEETGARLGADRLRIMERRQQETQEETEARLGADRLRIMERRQQETQEETEVRLETARLRMVERRQQETQEETEARLGAARLRMVERRQQETQEETEARIAIERIRASRRIQNRRNTLLPAHRVNNNTFDEENYLSHSCGPMNIVCQYCNAKHFVVERPTDGKFNNCCHKGKVILPRRRDPPAYLQDLMSNPMNSNYRHFNDNIRSYNSALSFASMGAQLSHVPGHGPYCFRVHGQIYHRTGNIHPNEGESRQYAQLYVVDSRMATGIRLGNHNNFRCIAEIMTVLDQMIRTNNVYALAYKMLGEVEREENERASEHNIPTPVVNMVFNRDRNSDRRRYNLPSVDEVAMIFTNNDGEPPFDRDFRVYPRNNEAPLITLNILSPNLDPMVYPLFFPYGEPGWQPRMSINDNLITNNRRNNGRNNISMLQYKVAQTTVRDEYNALLHGGKLFQQWAVDSYIQVEANNLNFVKYQQRRLKVEQYQGLSDHLANVADNAGTQVGRTVILPSSFQGSPRNMRERYQDAMALVRKFGKPDLFMTMTCNPSWSEIKDNLFFGQQPSDRPDIVARVFHIKLEELMKDILEKSVFGTIRAYCYSIEFQKRGLPHAHILFIIDEEDKFNSPDEIDKVVCAEIPNVNDEPRLHEIIKDCMIHGPCGNLNPNAPCMENNKCTKGFPKEFKDNTQADVGGYPLYRRRPNTTLFIRNNTIDNRYVVPYNKYLSLKFNCHINVEVCSSVKSVKYIYKYIYKGYDCVNAQMEINSVQGIIHDEISEYLNARYISAPEAMWRLLEYEMHKKSHAIIRLPVHLEREQNVYFTEGDERRALEAASRKNTRLTAWFILNRQDQQARELQYTSIPYHYVFNNNTTLWKPRQRGAGKIISRMYTVSPKDSQRYHLRILLLHVKGAVSFTSLRTVNGVVYATYKEAAKQRNLISNDDEWIRCLTEASMDQTPHRIRHLFALICALNNPNNPVQLYQQFEEKMLEDYDNQEYPIERARMECLKHIESVLVIHGLKCAAIGLPDPGLVSHNNNLTQQYDLLPHDQLEARISSLNIRQQEIFERIITAENDETAAHRFFFVDGPAGSGKTYLYNTLMCYLRRKGKTILSYATTGIAADLLGGRTVHSGFRLPVPVMETSTSSMRIPSNESNSIRLASVLIIDEVSMLSLNALRIIDMLLKEIMNNNKPFGGKLLLLGGDFRQTANVIPRGSNIDVIESCIKHSPLWNYVQTFTLSDNMRAAGQNEFSTWLLKIGDGTLISDVSMGSSTVEIPRDILIKNHLPEVIYGDSIEVSSAEAIAELATKIILTCKNKDAMSLNNELLDRIVGDVVTYKSADSHVADDDESALNFPVEFLNQQIVSGLPPHELKLKKGSIIMLLRNLNPRNGLLNGTRLVVLSLNEHYIHARILTGSHANTEVLIPRLDLMPSDTTLPFVMKRRQFPVIPALAMTINKSQGQSFDKVGLFLPRPVFSHGQLYVALSRARNRNNLKVEITETEEQGELIASRIFTKNVVLKDLL